MTQLVEALHALGLDAELAPSGRWAKFQGERCAVYVTASARGTAYYTWCDDPSARSVEAYRDAVAAIQAGLRRAAGGDRSQMHQ